MISNDNFAGAFGAGPTQDMAALARNAVRLGFAVVPIEPGGKVPLCTLAARAAKMADLEAVERGERKHPCGINHAITDPAEADRVFKRLSRERPGLNIGVETGRSRLILVDCDNYEAVVAWSNVWIEHTDLAPAITVRTPGRQSPDGTWVHKDGAHFWYSLPEDTDLRSLAVGSMQLPGQVSISWHSRQALVPPSVRHEGAYRLVGQVAQAPEWLLDMIVDHAEAQATQRAAQRLKMAVTDGSDPIDVWSAQAPWADLLEAAGWTYAGAYDTCGPNCAIWTRPGAANLKSATAHEPECLVTDTSTGWGPLHIWSDDAKAELGASHLSKLQFVAKTQHGGDTPAAMAALDLGSLEAMAVRAELDGVLEDLFAAGPPRTRTRARESDTEPSPLTLGGSPLTRSTPTSETPGAGSEAPPSRIKALFADLGPIIDGTAGDGPVPAILTRADGAALFYPGTLNGLFGEPESGKSWVALAACAEVLGRGGVIAYLDLDGNGAIALTARLTALGCDWQLAWSQGRILISDAIESKEQLALFISVMVTVHPDLVIIDALGDALPLFGAKTDSNDEVTVFLNTLAAMARAGAAVVTIDHVTKNPEDRGRYAIGAQAKKARMDGAYMIVEPKDGFARGRGGSAYLKKAKDRHGHVAEYATAKPQELWGTFVLTEFGWAVLSPEPGMSAAGPESREEHAMDRAMVTVSAHLCRLAMDAEETGTSELAITSAEAIRKAAIGVTAARVQPALNRLRDGGYIELVSRGRYPAWKSVKPYVELEAP